MVFFRKSYYFYGISGLCESEDIHFSMHTSGSRSVLIFPFEAGMGLGRVFSDLDHIPVSQENSCQMKYFSIAGG